MQYAYPPVAKHVGTNIPEGYGVVFTHSPRPDESSEANQTVLLGATLVSVPSVSLFPPTQ
jgi:hypothetical protein